MMVSNDVSNTNLIGPMIQTELFKDTQSFDQFMELMNTASLYSMRDILTSNCELRPGTSQRTFKVKLNKDWFQNDSILIQTAGDD